MGNCFVAVSQEFAVSLDELTVAMQICHLHGKNCCRTSLRYSAASEISCKNTSRLGIDLFLTPRWLAGPLRESV